MEFKPKNTKSKNVDNNNKYKINLNSIYDDQD